MALFLAVQRGDRRRRRRRPRIFRDRSNALDWMNDQQVIKNYRLTRDLIFRLIEELLIDLERATRRNNAISPTMQVLITLIYYATGSFYGLIAEGLGISKSSVCVIIDRVTKAICARRRQYIQFPMDPAEQRRVKSGFFAISSFPNMIGAVDGTLIAIRTPIEHKPLYVCRKGFHALNVQIICDSNLYISNIVARWPGSCHDSYIFENSEIYIKFESNQLRGCFLLGDSGYPCRPYLLTPFLRPNGQGQERYNRAQTRSRSVVERCIGLLKSRYRCLHHKTAGCLMRSPSNCARVIVACAVLHNICIQERIPYDMEDIEVDDIDEDYPLEGHVNEINATGAAIREGLVRDRFS